MLNTDNLVSSHDVRELSATEIEQVGGGLWALVLVVGIILLQRECVRQKYAN